MSENEELFTRLTKFIQSSNAEQTAILKEEIHSEVLKVKAEVEDLRKNLQDEIHKREVLEIRQKNQEQTNKHIERNLKKNNIIIWNLAYDDSVQLPQFVVSTLNSLLDVNLTLDACNNIYPMGRGNDSRPIIVQFISFLTKVQVLKQCRKLKGSNVSISEDLPKDQRRIRKILVKQKKLAIEKGNKAYISGDFLYVNDEKYSCEELEDQDSLEEVNVEQKLTKSNSAPATPTTSKSTPTESNKHKCFRVEENVEVLKSTPVHQHPVVEQQKRPERLITRKVTNDKEETKPKTTVKPKPKK